jgi:TetR/AcrR family tetracycline transcriptional repressor
VPPVSRAAIVERAHALQEAEGPGAVTMRRLGAELGIDPALIYRRFGSKDEILHEVGDRILALALDGVAATGHWRADLRDLCLRLRRAHLAQPQLVSLARNEPPRQPAELLLTDLMLRALGDAGFGPDDAADAYHALVGLTLGAAAVDAPVAQLPEAEREGLYERWRADYRGLDPARFGATVAVADRLYRGSAERRFEVALDLMLDALAARATG